MRLLAILILALCTKLFAEAPVSVPRSTTPFGLDESWKPRGEKTPDYDPENYDSYYNTDNPFLGPEDEASVNSDAGNYENVFLSGINRRDVIAATGLINPYGGYLEEAEQYSGTSSNVFLPGSLSNGNETTVESEMERLYKQYWNIK